MTMTDHSTQTTTITTIAGFPAITASPDGAAATKAPLVFLHGAFADEACFGAWVGRAAAHGHPAVSAARRGRHGIGPERAAGLTIQDYLDDTLAVIDAVEQQHGAPPVLVGHSLGALLAQLAAERGRARAVALLAPAPPAMLTAQAIALPRFAPQMPRIMSGRPFIVGGGACNALALNRVGEQERPDIHAHLTHESGKVYRALMMGTVRVDASKVAVPVFVAGGDEDRIISERLTRKTAKHYGVAAKICPGHGHWLIGETGWEQLADDVFAWVDAMVSSPR